MAVALLAATAAQPATAADTRASRAQSYTLDHVVRIDASDPTRGGPLVGFGAGILVGQTLNHLYIATANHVVRSADGRPRTVKVTVRAFGIGTVDGQVMAPFDAARDMAVLRIAAPPLEQVNLCADQGLLLKSLHPSAAKLDIGSDVMPLGHPKGRNWMTVPRSGPLVSWEANRIEFESSWLGPGHSGGALVDADSALIGMVVRDSAPLGEALPVETLLKQLKEWGVPVTLATQRADRWGSPWSFGRASLLDHWMKERDFKALDQALRHCRAAHLLAVRTSALDVRKIWNLPEDHRTTPSLVWLAARANDTAALRVLLQSRLPAHDRTGHPVRSPLQLAASLGHTEIIQMLVQAGALVDYADLQGHTALHQAVLARQWAAARQLLALGANGSLQNKQGQTAADMAGTDAGQLGPAREPGVQAR